MLNPTTFSWLVRWLCHSQHWLSFQKAYFSVQLAEIFIYAGHILSVCVWILAMVAQTITAAAHRDLWSCVHRRSNEPWLYTKNQVSLTYFMGQNRLPKKLGMNRHFPASWASQPVGCSFELLTQIQWQPPVRIVAVLGQVLLHCLASCSNGGRVMIIIVCCVQYHVLFRSTLMDVTITVTGRHSTKHNAGVQFSSADANCCCRCRCGCYGKDHRNGRSCTS